MCAVYLCLFALLGIYQLVAQAAGWAMSKEVEPRFQTTTRPALQP